MKNEFCQWRLVADVVCEKKKRRFIVKKVTRTVGVSKNTITRK